MWDRQNAPIRRSAILITATSTCPIALGDAGLWNNNGTILVRNVDGTDTVSGAEASAPDFTAICKTAVALPTCVYSNGTLGAGATLTKSTNGAIGTVGGVALTSANVGQNILVDQQASSFQNGVYTITSAGSAGTKWVLTRAVGMDIAITDGTQVVVQQGTYADQLYDQTATVVTIGTDAVTFALGAVAVTGGSVATALAAAGANNAVVGSSLSAGAMRMLAFAGHNNVGACTATGAKVGDTVVGIIDLAGGSVSAAASFESTITVNDQIQQTSASNLSAVKYCLLVVAKS